ncbi:MAG: biotin--[acetyl-CoA-carboxylase] ligase [Paucimonas sp.]|nr:biotin--[acetyl-CoA-carboxylase] ligase [Paucimonas sp.]
MSDLLSPQDILHRFTQLARLVRPGEAPPALAVECVARTASTNADLLQRLPTLDGPLLLVAEEQTAGRGRAGRSWLAQPGASLTFSLAWPFFRRDIAGLPGLSLAVGVAIADALASLDILVQLKWPNDIQLGAAKLGGVLIEAGRVKHAGHQQTWAVVGIGLNIALAPDAIAAIGRPVAQMPALAGKRHALLAALAHQLVPALSRFDAAGLAPFSERWNALHMHAGQGVRILDHGRVQHEGLARGIDESGCLLLETAAGTIAIQAGDVSLRPANDAGVSPT